MKLSRFFTASLLVFALILTGCGSFISEVRDGISEELGLNSSEIDNTAAYHSAMSSLNEYSDLINDVYDEMDYLEYDLFYYNDDVEYYDPGVYEPTFTCSFELYSYDWLAESTRNPSYELTETERQDLIAQADAIFASVDSTKETCRELDRYVSAQDYKDDAFFQSVTLIEELYAEMDAYYVLHDQMVDTLEAYYEIYENFVVDPNDPISVGIGFMREDMDIADAFIDILDDAYATETFDRKAELDTLYAELVAAGEVHSPDPGIWDTYVLDWYNYFYTDLQDDFIPAAKRSIRAFESGSWTELDSAYWDLIDYYGYMIDDYNTYLDTAGY